MNDRLRCHGQGLELLGHGARRPHAGELLLRLDQLTHHDVVGASQGAPLAQDALSVLFGNAVPCQAASLVEPRVLLIELSNVQPTVP